MGRTGMTSARAGARSPSPAWAWLALAAAGVLLAAFQQVVLKGVGQADERHAAERELYRATWRCNLRPTKAGRAECRAALAPQSLRREARPAD